MPARTAFRRCGQRAGRFRRCPSQRDARHVHADAAAVYRLTDGKSRDNDSKAGGASFKPPVGSRSFENVGADECRAVIVERK